ncbi:lipoprotein [Achromobacter sp. Root565]|uniref:LPS translocon maturation chaperone LptM n=1 Tax=Achromobacter sp. Root565 TaxID=1736564 RepID=UPI001F3BE3D1|nr:lipoprotein [Achromobacter sp. Root565]
MALRIVATLMAAGMVTACGYKGPLFMPPPPEGSKAPARTQQNPPPAQIPPAPVLP